jgi:hypothetical protein
LVDLSSIEDLDQSTSISTANMSAWIPPQCDEATTVQIITKALNNRISEMNFKYKPSTETKFGSEDVRSNRIIVTGYSPQQKKILERGFMFTHQN